MWRIVRGQYVLGVHSDVDTEFEFSLSFSLSLYCEELISVCYYLATAEFLPVLSKDSSIRIILRCTRHHRVASSLFRRRCRNRTDQSYQENASSIFPRELMSPDTEI